MEGYDVVVIGSFYGQRELVQLESFANQISRLPKTIWCANRHHRNWLRYPTRMAICFK
jgi:hypothetical protein